jgi:hypothetical protein
MYFLAKVDFPLAGNPTNKTISWSGAVRVLIPPSVISAVPS